MNEKQAWKVLKNAYLETEGEGNLVYAKLGKLPIWGLCLGIDCLRKRGSVSWETVTNMKKKIEKVRDSKSHDGFFGYKWACTKRGAQVRVKFCDKMIKELDKK